MRRYDQSTHNTITVKGRSSGVKFGLTPITAPVVEATPAIEVIPPCVPAITDLFWFSDDTGLYDQPSESAVLSSDGHPILDVAQLLGETCDLPITWSKTWTPDVESEGTDPGYLEDRNQLVVYQLVTTTPGTLEVSATCNDTTYGPISLSVLAALEATYCTLKVTFEAPPGSGSLHLWILYNGSVCIDVNPVNGTVFDSRDVSGQNITYTNSTGAFRSGNKVIFHPEAGVYSVDVESDIAYRETAVDLINGLTEITISLFNN